MNGIDLEHLFNWLIEDAELAEGIAASKAMPRPWYEETNQKFSSPLKKKRKKKGHQRKTSIIV